MNNDISTSIQYQISNVVLFDQVYKNWVNFYEKIQKGPEEMKHFLFDMWNKLKLDLKNNKEIIVKDIDREVSINDFDVTFNRTKNGTSIFFITLPDYDYQDAASKYVAIALTPKMPRYFTLEYSKNSLDSSTCWFIGEFAIIENHKKHINYGKADNMRLSWFAGYILGMLEANNL